MSNEVLMDILSRKVPLEATAYCVQLWEQNPFHFKMAKDRSSKLGDFRFDPRDQSLKVTVNANLNPYQFLITYIHEVAHRYAFNPKKRLKPHGIEWKMQFQKLMLPMLNTDVFPDDVLRVLARHMKNPKASTAADPKLVEVLARYSENEESRATLKGTALNSIFNFRGKAYRKLEEKRTRALCEELNTGRRYLIPMIIEVD